eukprot:6078893-Pleurochrysis_carterae.AAC.2
MAFERKPRNSSRSAGECRGAVWNAIGPEQLEGRRDKQSELRGAFDRSRNSIQICERDMRRPLEGMQDFAIGTRRGHERAQSTTNLGGLSDAYRCSLSIVGVDMHLKIQVTPCD